RPRMVLSGLRVRNQEVVPGPEGLLKAPLYDTKEIRLTSEQSDFTFGYTAFSYRNPQEIQYRYMLENHDPEWVRARKQRSARYSRVPPGSYTFRVQAVDSRGFESEIASIGVTILPPWWRTWWAYGMYVLIFASGVFVVDRIQRRRLIRKEREKARERELEQARKIEQAYRELEEAHNTLKRAQDQLIQQEKLASLGQLTAGIAHEIKNPLNFVNNFSDVSVELIAEARDEVAGNSGDGRPQTDELLAILDDVEANLRKIHEHGSRADRIVKSMLEHSRGGSGKRQPTDLNALIREYCNLSFHGMRASPYRIDVDIELQLDEDLDKLVLNPEEMSRVFINLFNNAFDAMWQKQQENKEYEPRITVRTLKQNGAVRVEVEDNGPGIPDKIREKILQPFFTTKRGTEGTGLGLSICNDILKAHGGSIHIESRVGEFTKFIITIPK
ncbi:MAG: ATP-binding protein, partial [Balneolaceae bacterium]|nr:ATP-binding protein [Balneolaceae bacterium]